MVHVAFEYMGKPAVFHRILAKFPDLKILLKYAKSNDAPALTGGDGIIQMNKTVVLEISDTIGLEYVKMGQIIAVEHEIIHILAMVIRTECDYMTVCDSLGVPLEYGPQALPKYGTWMWQTEATLLKFFSCHTGFLYKMALLGQPSKLVAI